MNLPNIPTDNLYKFIAIFGLIGLLYAYYLHDTTRILQLNNFKESIEENNKKHAEKIKFLLQEATDLTENHRAFLEKNLNEKIKFDSLKYASNGNLAPIEIIKGMHYLNYKIQIDSIEIIKLKSQKNIPYIEIYKSEIKMANLIQKQFDDLLMDRFDRIILLHLISSFLIVFGFWKWYFKYQQYIDAEIKIKGQEYIDKLEKRSKKKSKKEDKE